MTWPEEISIMTLIEFWCRSFRISMRVAVTTPNSTEQRLRNNFEFSQTCLSRRIIGWCWGSCSAWVQCSSTGSSRRGLHNVPLTRIRCDTSAADWCWASTNSDRWFRVRTPTFLSNTETRSSRCSIEHRNPPRARVCVVSGAGSSVVVVL